MNKIILLKKAAAVILLANLALITHDSQAMLLASTKPGVRTLKTTTYAHRKSSTYPFILTEPCYIALCKQNKKNKEKLRILRQNPDASIRDIWRLEDKIKKDTCMIVSFKQNISDETTE